MPSIGIPSSSAAETRCNIGRTEFYNRRLGSKKPHHMMHPERYPARLKPLPTPVSFRMQRPLSTEITRKASTKRMKVPFHHQTHSRVVFLHRRRSRHRAGWYDNNDSLIRLLLDEAISQKEDDKCSTANAQTGDLPNPYPNPLLLLPSETIPGKNRIGGDGIPGSSEEQCTSKMHIGDNCELPLVALHRRTRGQGVKPRGRGRPDRTRRADRPGSSALTPPLRRKGGVLMRRSQELCRRSGMSAAAASRSCLTGTQQDALVASFEALGLCS